MTQDSLGKDKVDIGKERVLAINPEAQVTVFQQGITPTSYLEFCQGANVVCNQVDQLSAIIMLHYAADRLRLPLITASRMRWPARHFIGVKIYDYRAADIHYRISDLDVEKKWG